MLINTCITGIGTAIKIKDLIVKSLDGYSNAIKVMAYDYFKLKNGGLEQDIFSSYNVVAIIGTKDPQIDKIPFFSLEDIISGKRESHFCSVLKDFIPRSIMKDFRILGFFSL